MSWAIQTRVNGQHGDHGVHVKARYMALGSINDVTMVGGRGVRTLNSQGSTRREMNAFSPPIEGTFDFDDGLEHPEVILEWSDGGELSQETFALTTRRGVHDATAGPAEPPLQHGGLRMLLRKHPTRVWRRHR
jgi:hypothetical protein